MATYSTLKRASKFCTATRYRLTFEKERFFYRKEIFSFGQRETNGALCGQKSETKVGDNYISFNIQAMFNAYMHGIIFSLSFIFAYYLTLYQCCKFLFQITSVLFPRRSS